ncbi:LysR family transcriptional regulator [Pokkaliibacter sp. MBI-7]|uniref:LysR family transcriptional regulator n=1 Tax=Pokkaliibacter sp. MBI-7 TaxID=3040600 RepID=UPI00244A21EC|nr:LysR family transcriptional regulator [Pokkaliibacter sp. MBI-7]MDH2433550.1 LysR family transcriptional regulator [Pokkaliibacter sp. MBI-7]
MLPANLNLLRTLAVLLEEQHVTRAAERLCLTQSAVSRQLLQLRQALADPLLVRDGNRLLPTPRALAVQAQLRPLLQQCDALFSPQQFDPQLWQGHVRMASSDYAAHYILPDIVSTLAGAAPQLQLTYQLWLPQQLSQLADLPLELVATMLEAIPPGLEGLALGEDGPVCVMRQDHPLAQQQRLTVDDLLACEHLSLSGGGDKDSFVDLALAELGRPRRIRLHVPFFTSALRIISRSELLLIIPEHIARNMQADYAITYRPFDLPCPTHRYWLLWHPKYHDDVSHTWLRKVVFQCFEASLYSMASKSIAHKVSHDS